MPQPAQARERATRSVECHCEPAPAAATDALLQRPQPRTPTQGPLLNKCTINFYNSNIAPGRRSRPRPPPPAPTVIEEIREVEEEARIPMFAPRRAPPSMRPDSRVYDRYGFDGYRRGRSPAQSFGNSPSRFNGITLLDRQNGGVTLRDDRGGEVFHYPGVSPPRGRSRAAARSRIPIPIAPVRGVQQFERPRYNSQAGIDARCHPDRPSVTMGVFRAEEERRLREHMRRQFARHYKPARARNRAAGDGVRARRVRDRWESDSSTEIGGLVQSTSNLAGPNSVQEARDSEE
ncbi:hypothetical protein C8A01DRAFT_31466 [Parachaetomium inaequale]|uniref:Uncharacterized protein n=1 Tax=Parachaetomium inaequale TaxID=2588326 RepID=A0AAN6PR31_9PEZI|nr:hypothetical protein C8A01DRAFT_31466 [Parachaetomium inaequale]